MKQLYPIPAYTMKCRVYLNENQKKLFEDALHAIKVVYNGTLYRMMQLNPDYVEEKTLNGEVLHFPNFAKASSSANLGVIREENPIAECIPAYALSGTNGCIQADLKRALSKYYENATKKSFKTGKFLPIEAMDYKKLRFICKKYPRKSFTFTIKAGNIFVKDNRNVIYLKLGKFGHEVFGNMKIRGWNKNIFFDEKGEIDLIGFASLNPKKDITITLLKEAEDEYYISFKFAFNEKKQTGIQTYKYFEQPNGKQIGIDVGKKTLVTCSDREFECDVFHNGDAENKKFKAEERERLAKLRRLFARSFGFGNEKFRKQRKSDKELQPSKRSLRLKAKIAKLERKIARRRKHYNNLVSTRLVENCEFIGIESLTITGWLKDPRTEEQKNPNSPKFVPKRYIKRTNENTLDAGLGQLLQMIKYKTEWYLRICVEIGRWFPSSKRCHICGYIKRNLTLKDRDWICPECGTHHDRDENAALGILEEALRIFNSRKAE